MNHKHQKTVMGGERFRHNRESGGFTLIETLVTIVISVVVTVFVVGTTVAGLNGIHKTRQAERLHANATVLSDVFSYWIKKGSGPNGLSVPDPETLIITLPDATTKTIARIDDDITVDSTPVTTSDIVVTSIQFTKLARSVRIAFTLASGDESWNATTTVAQRN